MLNDWSERLRDRARRRSFLRFLWRRFLDDRLFEAAGALSYTTVFALVPLSIVVFGVLSAFPIYSEWSAKLSDYIFSNFVPSSARAVEAFLVSTSGNIGKLTIVGVIGLVISLLITIGGIESSFNRIWRVKTSRPKFRRLLVYWTVLTLGALVSVASLALVTQFFSLALFETEFGRLVEGFALRLAPMVIELAAFATIFRVVPHRSIHWRHALAGAVLAVVMFELVKWGVGLYIGSFNTYEKLYAINDPRLFGVSQLKAPAIFTAAPVFLLWIYLSWVSVLLGASFASSISAFRYQPASMRLPDGYELYGLLRMLGRFGEHRQLGHGLHSDQIQQLEPMLTDDLVQQMLAELEAIGLLSRAESGEWLLSRDLEDITMAELYEACGLRIPIAEAHLPCGDDALGIAAVNELDQLREPVRELLKRRVSSVYESLSKDN